jgi:uncharacterized protein (DUF2236 family)
MTLAERINGERLVVLGWGRAILMQIAHPLVAAGVADHSTFRDTPASRYTRLHATIKSMLALTFGPPAERQAAIDRINAIHDRVNGTLKTAAGRFPAGTPYSATDPALLLWVEATLRDSMPLAYETFVAPLAQDQREAYAREGAEVASALRIPLASRPPALADVNRYLDQMLTSDALAVTPTARELAREVITPPYSRALGPVSRLNRLATIGLLPARLRQEYGFTWTPDDEAVLAGWASRTRRLRRLCPDRLARWR